MFVRNRDCATGNIKKTLATGRVGVGHCVPVVGFIIISYVVKVLSNDTNNTKTSLERPKYSQKIAQNHNPLFDIYWYIEYILQDGTYIKVFVSDRWYIIWPGCGLLYDQVVVYYMTRLWSIIWPGCGPLYDQVVVYYVTRLWSIGPGCDLFHDQRVVYSGTRLWSIIMDVPSITKWDEC